MKKQEKSQEINRAIVKAISNYTYNQFRTILNPTTKEETEMYLHDTAIKAAIDIIIGFTRHNPPASNEYKDRNNWAMLCAEMQVGKTGVGPALTNILWTVKYKGKVLANYFGIKKVIYITGMNFTDLHNQTANRIIRQTIGLTINKFVNGVGEIKNKENTGWVFINKNSDTKAQLNVSFDGIDLNGCLILIDEAHWGSDEDNVLTRFFEDNKFRTTWGNLPQVKKNKTYVVSVSATNQEELLSDISNIKNKVILESGKNYYGTRQFLGLKLVKEATKDDFINNKLTHEYPIMTYIKDALIRINKNNKKGVVFIRLRNSPRKLELINNKFIKDNFELFDLDTNKTKKIEYAEVSNKIEQMLNGFIEKPIIFFVKGAFTAGMTIEKEYKDYVYLVHDYSPAHNPTMQGLFGRMCGYRLEPKTVSNTIFYVNKYEVDRYAKHIDDNFSRETAPTKNSRLSEEIISKGFGVGVKSLGNWECLITKKEIDFISQLSDDELRKYFKANFPKIKFDYIGEKYLSSNLIGKTKTKWVEQFTPTNIHGIRPKTDNKWIDGLVEKRNVSRTEAKKLGITESDIDKKFIHLVYDSKNKKLLIYYGIIVKKMITEYTSDVKQHKITKL